MRYGTIGELIVVMSVILAGTALAEPAPTGAKLFEANCQVCHQAEGTGVLGAFPRLTGRAPTIASSPEGRSFLAKLVLSGMSGGVTVDSQRIMGVMPAFAQLSDAELAAVLTYIETLGAIEHKPLRFKTAEIAAARRTESVSPNEMATLRNALAARRLVP